MCVTTSLPFPEVDRAKTIWQKWGRATPSSWGRDWFA